MPYYVYMLLCVDQSFYIGVTNDLPKRFKLHMLGKGAKYTRSHKPLKIVYQELREDKGSALRREHELKKLSHAGKLKLTLV